MTEIVVLEESDKQTQVNVSHNARLSDFLEFIDFLFAKSVIDLEDNKLQEIDTNIPSIFANYLLEYCNPLIGKSLNLQYHKNITDNDGLGIPLNTLFSIDALKPFEYMHKREDLTIPENVDVYKIKTDNLRFYYPYFNSKSFQCEIDVMKKTYDEITTFIKHHKMAQINYLPKKIHQIKIHTDKYLLTTTSMGEEEKKYFRMNKLDELNEEKQNIKKYKYEKTKQTIYFNLLDMISTEQFNKKYQKLDVKQKDKIKQILEINKTETTLFHEYLNNFDARIASELKKIKKLSTIDRKKLNICEHEIKMAEDFLKTQNISVTQKNATKLFGETIDINIYCSICGKLIVEEDNEILNEFIGEERVYEYEKNDLNDLIFRLVNYITQTYIKFKTPKSYSFIINSISKLLYNKISEIEFTLKKIQTNLSDNMKDLITVYITIYTFAILSQMIILNYGQMTFALRNISGGEFIGKKYKSDKSKRHFARNNKKFKKTKTGFIIDNFKSRHSDNSDSDNSNQSQLLSIISDNSDISNDSYHSSNLSFNSDSEIETDSKEKKGGAETANKIIKNVLSSASNLIKSIEKERLKKLINFNIEDVNIKLLEAYQWVRNLSISNSKNKEQIIVNPSNVKDYIKIVEKITNTKIWKEADDNIKNIYNNINTIELKDWSDSIMSQYYALSYHTFAYLIKNNISQTKYVPKSRAYEDFEKELKPLHIMERNINEIYRYLNLHPLTRLPRTSFVDIRTEKHSFNLASLYDEDGQPRKWTSFIYSNGKKQIEVKSDDFKFITPEYKLIDRLDGKFKESEMKEFSSKIMNNLYEKKFNKAFYNYYEIRCPEGNIHEFDKLKCHKCSFQHNYDEKYINKYKHKFLEMLNNLNFVSQNILQSNIDFYEKTQKYKITENKAPNYKYNETNIILLSRAVKTDVSKIFNLGFSQYFIYSQVKNNIFYKQTDEKLHEGRILVLYNYLLILHYIFQKLVRQDTLIHNYTFTIDHKLIDISNDIKINDLISFINSKNTSFLICNFIIDKICQFILKIHKQSPKLAMELLEFIFEKEELLSKPDPMKIQKNEHQGYESSESSDFLSGESGAESVSDINPAEESDGFNLDETGIDDINDGNDNM
jgi:hypothetical protein